MDRALSSSFRDAHPQFSPDGKRVTFYSYRGGSMQVWVANSDGSQPAALTSMAGPTTGSPRWSPDGQSICFDSNTGGAYHVYVIASDGGQPRQVSSRTAYTSNWSRDGHWLYFGSTSPTGEDVWKVPASGGDAQQVTHNGGTGPLESPDGRTLYFVKSDGLWKMPVEGGEEKQVLTDIYRVNYAVSDKGIYFTPRNGTDGSSAVEFLDFATGKTAQIVKVTKFLDLGLTISPDEKTLLYTQFDYTGANLMLVDNFH
jgi:Tol biopolymer transport system component